MMRILPNLPVLAAVAAIFSPTNAVAAPLVGNALRVSVAGGEFRGFNHTLRGFENHIWRFAPDGRVSAIYLVRVDRGKHNFQFEGGTAGTWAIEGNRLCIRWDARLFPASGCYSVVVLENVSVLQGHYVRLLGPDTFEGTLQR